VQIYPTEKADFNPETDDFDYLAGAEISESGELPGGMDSFVAEAGTYARRSENDYEARSRPLPSLSRTSLSKRDRRL
jgi:hypothetical protein